MKTTHKIEYADGSDGAAILEFRADPLACFAQLIDRLQLRRMKYIELAAQETLERCHACRHEFCMFEVGEVMQEHYQCWHDDYVEGLSEEEDRAQREYERDNPLPWITKRVTVGDETRYVLLRSVCDSCLPTEATRTEWCEPNILSPHFTRATEVSCVSECLRCPQSKEG